MVEQETIEKAADNYAKCGCWEGIRKQSFIDGVKWQRQDEKMKSILEEAFSAGEARWGCNGEIYSEPTFEEWFEQFKELK